MNERPNPRPDMIFIEALAALPDNAIITFGHNFTTASMMRCVRAEKNRAAVTPYLRLVETVQEMDREQFHGAFLCAACLEAFVAHPGEKWADYDTGRGDTAMTWYRCDSIMEVLCVADQFPEGIIAVGPRNLVLFNLQELVTNRAAMKKWALHSESADCAYISLFTDYASATRGNYDRVLHCGACYLPMLDHPTRSIMDAPLEERLAYCLRAHVNAANQGRPLSDNVKRMTTQALNDYEAGKADEAKPKD